MTIVRTLAVKISKRVVRWTAPGSKAWAEGLEREVEFIESDWRALAWAVGSARVLLERPPGIEGQKPKRWPTLHVGYSWYLRHCGTIWMSIMTFNYATEAAHASSWQVRIGLTVIALGWASFVINSVLGKIRERHAPPVSDELARAVRSREVLERRLAQSRTLKRWTNGLIPAAMCAGYALAQPKWLNGWAIFFAVLTTEILRRGSPAKFEVQIAKIDSRIAEYKARQMRVLTAGPASAEFIKTQAFPNLFRRRRQLRRLVVR